MAEQTMHVIDFEDTGERRQYDMKSYAVAVAQVRVWCTCGKLDGTHNGVLSAQYDPHWRHHVRAALIDGDAVTVKGAEEDWIYTSLQEYEEALDKEQRGDHGTNS